MRCSLVSGGSGTLTGVMLIDDLSVARAALPNVLFGNFWPNPSFELGSNLDQTDGIVSNWNRGGNLPTICRVITTNYASFNHSLALIDTDAGDFYGEWYSDVLLSGNASPGDSLNLQWFEMYNLSGTEMRLTVVFFNAGDSVVGETHFVTSGTTNAGWRGAIGNSTFTKRNGSVLVPTGAVKLRCSLVSGGPGTLTGVMIIDDLSVARVTPLVSGNFWLNPTFETGSDLDQPNGTPASWNRGGSDASIDQVTTNNFASSSHALAVVDSNASGYGEWYSDVLLAGHASPGDLLDVKWSEMYGITNGEMRVTVGFFTADGNFINETHFVASGNSAGWLDTIAGSPFVKRQQEVRVPVGAGKIRVSMVSAGPVETVGVMVLDDLTVALHPTTVQTGNLFPNPTFEEGDQLDNPTGALPAGIWARGGSDGSIDQVSIVNSVSRSHSLSLVDNNENGYGEWYGFLTLVGVVPGDLLDLQWYQLYSISNGNMRLTFAFTDANNTQLEGHDYNVSGQSPGWVDSIANSPFERQNQRLLVPEGTVKLRVNLASGGSSLVTGTMLIDDLSVRIGKLNITGFCARFGWFQSDLGQRSRQNLHGGILADAGFLGVARHKPPFRWRVHILSGHRHSYRQRRFLPGPTGGKGSGHSFFPARAIFAGKKQQRAVGEQVGLAVLSGPHKRSNAQKRRGETDVSYPHWSVARPRPGRRRVFWVVCGFRLDAWFAPRIMTAKLLNTEPSVRLTYSPHLPL